MKHSKAFSLSLQRELEKRQLAMDSEIHKAFNELRIKSLLHLSNIRKKRGYLTITLLYVVLLLPFMRKQLSSLWSNDLLVRYLEARKDTYYRFLNHERFNWRKFVYLLAFRVMALVDQSPWRQKVLIADDTIAFKTGQNMELVSYHFDHKTQRSVLGHQCLQLGYHNGLHFFPIDMAFHSSTKRPNERFRRIDRRTNGWRRRKEALRKRTDVLIEMLQRAWTQGMEASFVLFDSWFAHDKTIAQILQIGYGVICRLKAGRSRYLYQGQSYTLKELWQRVAKKKTQWLSEFRVKGVCLNVRCPKSGDVRVLFVSDGQRQWHAFLSTDLELEPQEILAYYARRWAIEIFFKDGKQLLYLGKEQSETFDAVLACYSLVMIRYLLLVYILHKYQLTGPMGPLFRDLSELYLQLYLTEKVWAYIKELMIVSSELLWPQMEPDKFIHLIEIVEHAILNQLAELTAKL
jgi:IS4 transposase